MSTALVVMVLAGTGTWLLRASFITFIGSPSLPRWVDVGLVHARPAVLAALVVTATLPRIEQTAEGVFVQLLALLVAALVARRTRNLTWSLAAGFVVIAGPHLLFPNY